MITSGSSGRARAGNILAIACWSVVTGSGCIQFAALWTNLTGGDVISPEFTMTKKPLLILFDDRNETVTHPRAIRRAHKEISDRFIQYVVNKIVIPFNDWQRLQQAERKYDKMSIREIGERLGADQVLYVRVSRFTVKAEAGAPLFKGEFMARVKVLSTDRTEEVRLWPRDPAGRRIAVTTPPTSMGGEKSSGDFADELGTKMGKAIAELFYEHREFSE